MTLGDTRPRAAGIARGFAARRRLSASVGRQCRVAGELAKKCLCDKRRINRGNSPGGLC